MRLETFLKNKNLEIKNKFIVLIKVINNSFPMPGI